MGCSILQAVAVIGALCGPAPPVAEPPRGPMGVNAQVLMQQHPSDRLLDRHLEAMRRGGVEVVRMDATWAMIEPTPPRRPGGRRSFHWAYFDRWVGRLARRGMRWLPVLAYSVGWSTETPRSLNGPPKGNAGFAGYAGAVARRYGAGGRFWREHPEVPPMPVTAYEVWNEPNFRVFWGGKRPDPARYAGLFLAARRELKRADPMGAVITGGLAGRENAPDFLRSMLAARPGLRGRVDGVALHLYDPAPGAMYERTATMRAAIDLLLGPDVPLHITEIGWVARTPGEERRRAARLSRVARELPGSACRIGLFLPHTWNTRERDRDDPEDWFGLVRRDAKPKPSGQAYLDAIRAPEAGAPPAGARPCE